MVAVVHQPNLKTKTLPKPHPKLPTLRDPQNPNRNVNGSGPQRTTGIWLHLGEGGTPLRKSTLQEPPAIFQWSTLKIRDSR